MITQEYLVGDLELRLSKSKPSQDLDVTYGQMAYWLDQARDSVTYSYIKDSKVIDSSLVMTTEGALPYIIDGLYYMDLGAIPLDLYKRSGLISVYDQHGNYISGQSLENKKRNSRLTFAKPSPCTVVYTLTGSSIMFDTGKDGYFNHRNKYFAELVPSELSRIKDRDSRYYAAPSTIESILEVAEEIGLRELTGRSIYDINDDGIGNDIN